MLWTSELEEALSQSVITGEADALTYEARATGLRKSVDAILVRLARNFVGSILTPEHFFEYRGAVQALMMLEQKLAPAPPQQFEERARQ